MRLEILIDLRGLLSTEPGECLEHSRRSERVVARLGHVGGAQQVRLRLLLSRVALEKKRSSELREIAIRLSCLRSRCDRADHESELCELCLRHPLRSMSGGDVPDLVAEYARELVFAVHSLEHSAGDVDVATRECHRIEHRGVQNSEGPLQIRPVAHGGDSLADAIYHLVDAGIFVVDAELADRLLVSLLPESELLLLGDETDLATSRGRIGGAGDEHEHGQSRADYTFSIHSSFLIRASGSSTSVVL